MAAADGAAPVEGTEEDPNDPDYIAAHPPEEAQEPETHFQIGDHAGKWQDFDERGVPKLNNKGKKLTKREKDLVETEYMEAKKKYQQQMKAWEAWEQASKDAEKALMKRDRARWAYRHVGPDKQSPVHIETLEDFVEKMGWDAMNRKDLSVFKKCMGDYANDSGELLLDDLREFTSTTAMPSRLLENRVGHDLSGVVVEGLYSPRTWRNKIEMDPPKMPKKEKKKKTEKTGGSRDRSGSRERPASRERSPDKSKASSSPRRRG